MGPGVPPSLYILSVPPFHELSTSFHELSTTLHLRWGRDRIPGFMRDTVDTPETDNQKYSEQKRRGAIIQSGLTSLMGSLSISPMGYF